MGFSAACGLAGPPLPQEGPGRPTAATWPGRAKRVEAAREAMSIPELGPPAGLPLCPPSACRADLPQEPLAQAATDPEASKPDLREGLQEGLAA